MPSERRSGADGSHRPHLTLYAGESVAPETDVALSLALADLDLPLELGSIMLFGPHRGRFVVVHSVVPTTGLLVVQRRVAELCGADPTGYFGPGRWSPHVTVARRVAGSQLAAVLDVVAAASAVAQPVRVRECRRWDSVHRRTWLL